MKPFAEAPHSKSLIAATPRLTARWLVKAAVRPHMAFYRCKAVCARSWARTEGIHRA